MVPEDRGATIVKRSFPFERYQLVTGLNGEGSRLGGRVLEHYNEGLTQRALTTLVDSAHGVVQHLPLLHIPVHVTGHIASLAKGNQAGR